MIAAPLIHARTKYNDFPANFLVAPSDFSPETIQWARKHVTDSTYMFEYAPQEGRRLIFCDKDILVTGISIDISELYRLCGREPAYCILEDGRNNYAFIGLVIPKAQIKDPFDVPMSEFLMCYERYMQQLWESPFYKDGIPTTPSDYLGAALPDAKGVFTLPKMDGNNFRYVLDCGIASSDSICAAVTMRMLKKKSLAFCTNVPNATSVLESDFQIVTSEHADVIREAMARMAQEAAQKDMPDGTQSGNLLQQVKSKVPEVMSYISRNKKKIFTTSIKIIGVIVVFLGLMENKDPEK